LSILSAVISIFRFISVSATLYPSSLTRLVIYNIFLFLIC
jgi:hypothetical protein